MNKRECKKYVRRAFYELCSRNMTKNPTNLEICMKKVINEDTRKYMAYGKMAMYNLNNSATVITAKQLIEEIDVIPKIYNEIDLINKAERL